MKNLKLFFLTLIAGFGLSINAQTADEIIETYLENIGGKENLAKIESILMTGVVNAQGMEIPIKTVSTNDGKMYLEIDMQGNKIKQLISDGKKVYNMNMMNQKMEEMPSDLSKVMINEFKDFPNPFIAYKEKGYTAEFIGKDTTEDGTEVLKVKLTKKPITIDGEESANESIYYFDAENYVPIVIETEIPTGPAKGQKMKTPLSDYQEVDGMYFPFSTAMQGMPMNYKTIELNPKIEDKDFELPEAAATPDADKKN
ncbi:outer membrane lipoprotein-sorting protein [Winogradskyella sp. R77965]|uniref:outer membrane lipoprotein-sorting protein n=1 Tax=Winogradskyella sp. R77965 TaxID=3093872 RepID=UPI0037DD5734